MNKVCKEYISDAKKFFPIMGKDERNYLRGLNGELEEFCEDKNITSKQELFKQYRQPHEIANDYYESVDTEKIIKKIKVSKYVKSLIAVAIAVVLIALSAYITFAIHFQIQFSREEMVDSSVIDSNVYFDNEHDVVKGEDFIEPDEMADEEIIEEEIIE